MLHQNPKMIRKGGSGIGGGRGANVSLGPVHQLYIYIYIPLKYNIIRIDGFAPPPESGGSQGEVRGKYSSLLIRRKRYLVTLARVSPRRNNRLRAQTSIFAIENQHFLVACIRTRRQKKYEIIQFQLFFSVFLLSCTSARKHEEYQHH